MDIRSWIPTAPSGFDAWEAVATVAVIGILKLYRAYVMKRRSVYVDRFGWSIIVYDFVFGLAALMGFVLAFYPELNPHIWITRISTGSILIMAAWQLLEVHAANDERMDAAVAGTTSPTPSEPTEYTGDNRRGPLPGRRDYDLIRKGESS